jgi:hypothetical protein
MPYILTLNLKRFMPLHFNHIFVGYFTTLSVLRLYGVETASNFTMLSILREYSVEFYGAVSI